MRTIAGFSAGLLLQASLVLGALRKVSYQGFDDSWELTDGVVEAVIVPGVGAGVFYWGWHRPGAPGRSFNYAAHAGIPLSYTVRSPADNILDPRCDTVGQSYQERGIWFYTRGHSTHLGPETADVPSHLEISIGRHRAERTDDWTLKLVSAVPALLGVRATKIFHLDRATHRLDIEQTVENVSDGPIKFAIWDRTNCRGGSGTAFVPVRGDSIYPRGFGLLSGTDPEKPSAGRYLKKFDPPQGTGRLGEWLLFHNWGNRKKVGLDSDAGWVGFLSSGLLYVKRFPVGPRESYSRSNRNTVEFFSGDPVEIGVLSPEVTLEPGESFTFPEEWFLAEAPDGVLAGEGESRGSSRGAQAIIISRTGMGWSGDRRSGASLPRDALNEADIARLKQIVEELLARGRRELSFKRARLRPPPKGDVF